LSSHSPGRFCVRCGAQRYPDALYCTRCGADLREQDAAAAGVPVPYSEPEPVPVPWVRSGAAHPVRLVVVRAPHHGRLGAILRLPAALAAELVSLAWLAVAIAAAVTAWFVRVAGRPYPAALRRVTSGWLQFSERTSAYAFMLTPEFPRPGPLGSVRVELPEPAGRPWLRLPALVPVVPLAFLEWCVAFLCAPVAWVSVLALGTLPDGLADVLEQPQRYRARFWAYALLLCDTYPWFQPEAPPLPEPVAENPVPGTVTEV
jgi:hypothetical protein